MTASLDLYALTAHTPEGSRVVLDLYAVGAQAGALLAATVPVVQLDETDLYGLDVDNWLYGLVHFEHQGCETGEYCRNPLHPGPCKGWKHMLHSVAPGAYHAYEQQRVAKLNEARQARIAELKAAGKAVPKHLLKPITYQQVPTAPAGIPFKPPTPKEAEAALPTTAKEIAQKIAMKHADIAAAQAKAKKALPGQGAAGFATPKDVDTYLHDFEADPNLAAMPALSKAVYSKKLAQIVDDPKATPEQVAKAKAILEKMGAPKAAPPVGSSASKAAKLAAGQAGSVMMHNAKLGPPDKPIIQAALEALHDHSKTPAARLAAYGSLEPKHVQALPPDVAEGIRKDLEHLAGGGSHLGGASIGAKAADIHGKLFPPTAGPAGKVSGPLAHPDMMAVSDLAKMPNVSPAQLAKALEKPGVSKTELDKLPNPTKFKIMDAIQAAYQKEPAGTSDGSTLAYMHAKLFGELPPAKLPAQRVQSSVSGGEPHPDMAHALEMLADYPSLTKGINALDKTTITKAEYAKLAPEDQQLIKDFLAEHIGDAPASVDHLAYKLGIDKLDLITPTGEKPKVGAAQAALAAIDAGKPMLSKIKKITPAEYEALSGADQKKIHDVLKEEHDAGHPKVAAEIAAGLGPKAVMNHTLAVTGYTPTKRAAPGEPHPALLDALLSLKSNSSKSMALSHLDDPGVTAAQFDALPEDDRQQIMDFLHEAAQAKGPATKAKAKTVAAKLGISLAGEEPVHERPSSTKGAAKVGGDELLPGSPAHVIAAHALATGLTYGTATKKLAAYGKLSAEEFHSLPENAQKAIVSDLKQAHDKFLDPKKKNQVLNLLEKLKTSEAILETPSGGVTPQGKMIAKAHAAILPLLGNMAAPVTQHELEQNYSSPGASLPDEAMALANAWYAHHVLDGGVGTALSPDDHAKVLQKAEDEILHMLQTGTTKPPSDGVLENADIADKNLHGANKAAMKASLLKQAANKQTGAGGSSHGGGTAAKVEEAAKSAGVPKAVKDEVLGAFKMHTQGAQLKDPPEQAYQALLNVAAAASKKPGWPDLSLRQIMQIIDEQHAKNLGVTNQGLLEQKMVTWLGTAEGKAAAANMKPDAATVKKLTGGVELPKGVKLKAGQKVQNVGGPGGYKKTDGPFHGYTSDQAIAERDAYQAQTGQKWTKAQHDALYSYTYASGSMNNYLRNEAGADTSTKQKIIDAQSAMQPLQHDHLLGRGTGWSAVPPEFRGWPEAQGMVGKTISDPAFLSTSVTGSHHGFSGHVVWIIEAPAGTMGAFVDDFSKFHGEAEMLLAAGTQLKILGVEQYGDGIRVRARVVSGSKTAISTGKKI